MKILVCGCIHSRFDVVSELQKLHNPDLCILLGDLETFFTEEDMYDSFLPKKYENMGTFKDLISQKITLECPTVAIGGNHEAPRVVWSLESGGFITKNLYYIGTNIVDIVIKNEKVTICGVSGTSHEEKSFKPLLKPFLKEQFAHDQKEMAIHHNYDLFKQLNFQNVKRAIYISHDWPLGITKLINKNFLVSKTVNLCDPTIGSKLACKLFEEIKNESSMYFCAHMHKNVTQFVNIPEVFDGGFDYKFEKDQKRVKFTALGRVWEQGFEVVNWDAEEIEKEDGVYKNDKLMGKFEEEHIFNIELIVKNGKHFLKAGDDEVELV